MGGAPYYFLLSTRADLSPSTLQKEVYENKYNPDMVSQDMEALVANGNFDLQ